MTVGELIGGNYVLGHVLGVGGVGVVHGAIQCSLQRTVAIKLPRAELRNDPRVRARFRNEALVASRIHHENIVRVFDFGEHKGAPYLVMEHVTGVRLGKLLRAHGPFPVDVAVPLVHQIACGLADAHDAGIVHADVRCDNVLIEARPDGFGVPRLIDFGSARFVDGTSAGPELRGELPTFASDVYAVGVMLYELVTGTTPSQGSPLRCPQLAVPYELEQIVSRALARDPAERFSDAGDLAFALEDQNS